MDIQIKIKGFSAHSVGSDENGRESQKNTKIEELDLNLSDVKLSDIRAVFRDIMENGEPQQPMSFPPFKGVSPFKMDSAIDDMPPGVVIKSGMALVNAKDVLDDPTHPLHEIIKHQMKQRKDGELPGMTPFGDLSAFLKELLEKDK